MKKKSKILQGDFDHQTLEVTCKKGGDLVVSWISINGYLDDICLSPKQIEELLVFLEDRK